MLALLPILASGSLAAADIRPLLKDQGFQGPLNGREAIDYVGHIRQDRNDYQIYIYRGVSRGAAADHGINWLIVISNSSAYLGGYHIPMPATCAVNGRKVVCNAGLRSVVKFTKTGPPDTILFDGEILHFEHRVE